MRFAEAIDWLRERGIPNEEGNDHVFGDDMYVSRTFRSCEFLDCQIFTDSERTLSAEAAERKMTDELNRPVFLTHFPTEIKSFYMLRAGDDGRVTESVDVLMPGVGEIVGGSMRTWDHDELLAGYAREGVDPTSYSWYTDQRKYGSTPHGGYGLGTERFLAWLMKLWTVREACLYPRYMGRCTP